MAKTYIMPMFAAVLMGIAAGGTYYGIYYLSGINILSLAVAVFIAVLVYFTVLIKIGGLTKKELKAMPKGAALVRVAKKLHLMR